MSVQIDGFEDLADKLDELVADMERLDGETDVPVDDLFTEQFMRTHTDVDSFEAFIEQSPWTVESSDDFAAIPEDDFDEYVESNSVFKDWKSMLSAAAREWIVRQLES